MKFLRNLLFLLSAQVFLLLHFAGVEQVFVSEVSVAFQEFQEFQEFQVFQAFRELQAFPNLFFIPSK